MSNPKQPTAEPFVPEQHSLPVLAAAFPDVAAAIFIAMRPKQCSVKGPANARIMFVGEQPGDQEDLQGKPFVGAAGQLWNRALLEAQIDRSEVYVTNAVKHFKFEERGKRRIHKKPGGLEVGACRP
jgi:uracil-DNA glycosylase